MTDEEGSERQRNGREAKGGTGRLPTFLDVGVG
jgi:hypothetical protein